MKYENKGRRIVLTLSMSGIIVVRGSETTQQLALRLSHPAFVSCRKYRAGSNMHGIQSG